MTKELTTTNGNGADALAIESALIEGDLSKLTATQRTMYYRSVCESLGLNHLTQPFAYIKLSGKLTLYARKDCTDQIRTKRGVSVQIVGREAIGDVYVVTARATDRTGRADESTGAVPIKGLSGEALANAYMKAETKSKRRVTLSIVGLGWIEESEVASIVEAEHVNVDFDTGEIVQPARYEEPKRIDPPKETAPEKKEREFMEPAELKAALMDKGDRLQRRIESGEWIPGYRDDRPNGRTPEESRTAALASLRGLGSDTLGIDDNRHAFLRFIFECDSSKLLTQGENEALIRWVGATREVDSEGNGVWAPHPIAIQEARAVLAAIREAVKEETLGDVAKEGAR